MSDIRAEFEKLDPRYNEFAILNFECVDKKILIEYIKYLEQHTIPIKDVIKMIDEDIKTATILDCDYLKHDRYYIGKIEALTKFKHKLEESDG